MQAAGCPTTRGFAPEMLVRKSPSTICDTHLEEIRLEMSCHYRARNANDERGEGIETGSVSRRLCDGLRSVHRQGSEPLADSFGLDGHA